MAASLPFVVDNKATSIAPGSAGLIVPPEDTYQALFNVPWNTWPWRADKALRDSPENARKMLSDPVIKTPLGVRIRSTVLLSWHIEPDDDEDEIQVKAAADVERRIRQLPFLQQYLWNLMMGIWYGRSACQTYYEWETNKDMITGIAPFKFDPVNGDKLIFGFGPNRDKVGIRVVTTYDGPKEQTDYGMVRWFTDKERANLVVHRHLREDADFREWMASGSTQGIGLRDELYWIWALKNQVLGYMMNYIQWFARGLTVYYYDAHNADAYNEVVTRVNEHNLSGLPVMIFPRSRDGGPGYNPVQRVEPGSASNNFIIELTTQYFDQLFRRAILGQDLTTVSDSSYGGEGRADLQGATFAGVVKFDSQNLSDSLTEDMVKVIYAYTYPGMKPGRWTFEAESPNVEQLVQAAGAFTEMGGQIDADEFRKLLGLPLPRPGAQLLSKQQPLQPTALGEIPPNTPVVTPPGSTQPGPVS